MLRALEIAIDPVSSSGQGILELKNTGQSKLTGAVLHADDFTSAATAHKLGAKVSFASSEGDKWLGMFPLELEPGQRITLKVLAEGVWDAGQAVAPLLIDGQELAQLVAIKQRVPFNLKLLASGSDSAPLVVGYGKKAVFQLENGDALNYRYAYRLALGDKEVAASTVPTLLSASSSQSLPIELPIQLFSGSATGMLRDGVRHGTLTIYQVDGNRGAAAAVSRAFPIVIALGGRSPEKRACTIAVIAFILLLCGGTVSLVLAHGVPNGFRRLALQQILLPLASQTKRLSRHIPSALRIGLRVHRLKLSERARAEYVISPGAAEVLEAVARDARVLARRVELLGRIDDRQQLIQRMGSDGPPDLLAEQQRRLVRLTRPLAVIEPDDAALKATETALADVDAQLALIDQEDEGLRQRLIADVGPFYEHSFLPAWEAASVTDAPWKKMLREEMSGFVEHAKRCFAKQHYVDETLVSLDTALTKMRLIVSYMRICETATPEQERCFDETGLDASSTAIDGPSLTAKDEKLLTQRQRFFRCLSGTGARALGQAHLVLRQAEQGIFSKHLVEQIRMGKLSIQSEAQSIGVNDLVAFRLTFDEDKFNDAAARDKLECTWTFHHRTMPTVERCWSPCQFFSEPGVTKISVEICRGAQLYEPEAKGGRAPCDRENPLVANVEVRASKGEWLRQRTRLEMVQLGVALGVTVVALLAGAREQLEKLEPLSGLAAVFALGFGADVVKNLISPSSSNGTITKSSA